MRLSLVWAGQGGRCRAPGREKRLGKRERHPLQGGAGFFFFFLLLAVMTGRPAGAHARAAAAHAPPSSPLTSLDQSFSAQFHMVQYTPSMRYPRRRARAAHRSAAAGSGAQP